MEGAITSSSNSSSSNEASSKYETTIGCSRAVRVGSMAYIGGTASVDENGKTQHPRNPYQQTLRCIEIAEAALHDVGASLHHVVRTRILLKDITYWRSAAKAHKEAFGDNKIRPVCTFMEVSQFIQPDWLVQIEMDAVISSLE